MTSRVLVVGGGNQIAAFLIPALLADGLQVIVHSRRTPPRWIPSHPAMDWGTGPLQQVHHRAQEVDALVYLAPLGEFSQLWRQLSPVARVVAFSSTSAVSKSNSQDDGERALAAELTAGEKQLFSETQASGAALTVLRPTLIYGAGLDQNLTRLASFVRRWRVMPLLGAGCGNRQPVHAQDLADVARKLIVAANSIVGTYDLPGGSILSYRLMVEKVFQSVNRTARFVSVPKAMARCALPLLRQTQRWRDLNLAMLDRMNQHLVYDGSPAQRDFDYNPRPFSPQSSTWLPLDQQKGL